MFTDERKHAIEDRMGNAIGMEGVIKEYCGNTSLLVGSLLKSQGAPADLTEMLALNYFFTEVIKRGYGIDDEAMDIELMKCYKTLDGLLTQAEANARQQQQQQVPAPAPNDPNGIKEMFERVKGEVEEPPKPPVQEQETPSEVVEDNSDNENDAEPDAPIKAMPTQKGRKVGRPRTKLNTPQKGE